ncbi:TIGR02646 family protein [Lachnospiraceae bacterium KHCPX20]|nr:TIGR02646 family protein [Lachnospiraceae bacterium KHCPX20]
MIKINKDTVPIELDVLRKRLMSENLTPEKEYNELKNPLKETVRECLMKEQGHLCAYCMRRIPDGRVAGTQIPGITLEHYIARNSKSVTVTGTGLGVDYNNLLAVCSGGRVPKGTYTDNEMTCDAIRGNKPLTVNPLDESTLATIYYKNNGEIAARDSIIEKDLVNTLNLNCVKYSSLPDGRKKALEPIEEHIASFTDVGDILDECKKLLNDLESETDPKTQYCGILIWWLKDYIEALET